MLLRSMLFASLYLVSAGLWAFDLASEPWWIWFDGTAKASASDAAKVPAEKWGPVRVGVYWNMQGYAADKDAKTPRSAWQKCAFKIPADFKAARPALRIGAIDGTDEAWLNGVRIGSTDERTPSYWTAPRNYPIPPGALKTDAENILLIRVEDARGSGGISAMPVEVADMSEPPVATPGKSSGLRTHKQTVELTFASEDDAKKAMVSIAPLPDDAAWAFSTRWDDNVPENTRMSNLMWKHGFKGTFYLYSGAEKDYATTLWSVGGHGMTHMPFSRLSKNELFYEAAAIRVELESKTDRPVNSFAFPGGDYDSQFDRSARGDIVETLRRGGYIHTPYPYFADARFGAGPADFSSGLEVSPGEGETDDIRFAAEVEGAARDEAFRAENPNITMGTHARLSDQGWKKMGRILRDHARRPDWWYCAQSEYAAYRALFRLTKLESSATGRKLVLKLERPWAADLGENVPLTLKVAGARPVSVSPAGGKTKAGPKGDFLVCVLDDYGKKTPELIDAVHNEENSPPDKGLMECRKIPLFEFHLWHDKDDGELAFTVRNKCPLPMEGLSVAFRTPLFCENGVERVEIGKVEAGETKTHKLGLRARRNADTGGRPYFWAQADFSVSGQVRRVHATCRGAETPSKGGCARDAARILGPVSPGHAGTDFFKKASAPGATLEKLDGREWTDKPPADGARFSRDVVPRPASQEWGSIKGDALMAVCLDFESKTEEADFFRDQPERIFLNGEEQKPLAKLTGLRKGGNRLVMVYRVNAVKPKSALVRLEPADKINFSR